MVVTIMEGSPRPRAQSSSFSFARLAGRMIAERGLDARVHRVVDLDPAALVHRDQRDADISSCLSELMLSDAVVVVTPIFQASYSGLLKVFLDLLSRTALAGKPTLALGTSGSATHGAVLTLALPPVLLALGCQHVIPPLCVLSPAGPSAPPTWWPAESTRRLGVRLDMLLAATTAAVDDRPLEPQAVSRGADLAPTVRGL